MVLEHKNHVFRSKNSASNGSELADAVEQGCFSNARTSDNGNKLSFFDVQADVPKHVLSVVRDRNVPQAYDRFIHGNKLLTLFSNNQSVNAATMPSTNKTASMRSIA